MARRNALERRKGIGTLHLGQLSGVLQGSKEKWSMHATCSASKRSTRRSMSIGENGGNGWSPALSSRRLETALKGRMPRALALARAWGIHAGEAPSFFVSKQKPPWQRDLRSHILVESHDLRRCWRWGKDPVEGVRWQQSCACRPHTLLELKLEHLRPV